MPDIVQEFLRQCLALDTESTGLCPTSAEICELGIYRFRDDIDQLEETSQLFGTVEPIPFAASAKNNISRKMLVNIPTFVESIKEVDNLLDLNKFPFIVAHNIKYDKTILDSHYARLKPEQKFASDNKWICTYRLAKQLYKPADANDTLSYSLSYLRYYLDIDVPESAAVHRAGDDAMVCYKLFEHMVQEIYELFNDGIICAADLGDIVYSLSTAPIVHEVLSFGKYKGQSLNEVAKNDPKYLMWCLDNMDTFKATDINYDHDLFLSLTEALEKVL